MLERGEDVRRRRRCLKEKMLEREEDVGRRRGCWKENSLTLTDGSHQDQDLSNSCNARGLLVLGAKSAKGIGTSLPKSGHDNNPAEAIAVQNCLTQVCDCEDAEQNGESHCRGKVGKVHPQRIASIRRNVAIEAGSCVRAEAGRARLGWEVE